MRRARSVSERLERERAARALSPDPEQQSAALRLDALRARLIAARAPLAWLRAAWRRPAPEPGTRGVWLWGDVGRGKTLLLDLFQESLEGTHLTAERTHFYRFMRAVHAELGALGARPDPLETVARGIAARTAVLCLDELLVADIADAMILSGLLHGLFRHGVALVATSNLEPRELYRHGLQRQRFVPAIELIERELDILHLDGGVDYRLRELEQAPTFFDARAQDAERSMQARFAALAHGTVHGASVLTIEGRPIAARATGPGMAWFEFAELCLGARSQNDYIEIARLYGTVFLSNVPVLGADDDDAARRFIMLIDELYDRGVKLVLSAMAPPASLYRGERLASEFARAASRLVEMQTTSYLAGRHRA